MAGFSTAPLGGPSMRSGYRYHSLTGDKSASAFVSSRQHGLLINPRRRVSRYLVAALFLAALFCLTIIPAGRPPTSSPDLAACDTPERGFQCQPVTSHSWGQYSPYFSVPSELDAAVPEECRLTFAQVLSRHGARDPTAGKTTIYKELVDRIQRLATTYGPGFESIKHLRYTLGADQLTAFGQQELVHSGINFYSRYKSLARESTPFVRSSGQDRVVTSARNWTQGFHRARSEENGSDSLPYDLVIIPEGEGLNNTLNHRLCTSFEKGKYARVGLDAEAEWLEVFAPPITERLNRNLPGTSLTDRDTVYLMDLCPFHTAASPKGSISPLCALFTETEWHDYSYYQSISKWYGFGPGNPLGSTQGVGYVNELVSRLTRSPVHDRTSINSTLDGSPATFPLNRTLYADFSHDNDMTSILAALGLYNATAHLPTQTRRPPALTGGYAAAWTVPFAARVYVEKMTCAGEDDELVRILVNDRVLPLQSCGADELGRCKLAAFVESLSFAAAGGHWDLCFE